VHTHSPDSGCCGSSEANFHGQLPPPKSQPGYTASSHINEPNLWWVKQVVEVSFHIHRMSSWSSLTSQMCVIFALCDIRIAWRDGETVGIDCGWLEDLRELPSSGEYTSSVLVQVTINLYKILPGLCSSYFAHVTARCHLNGNFINASF